MDNLTYFDMNNYITYFAYYYLLKVQLILIFLAFLAYGLSERCGYNSKIGDILDIIHFMIMCVSFWICAFFFIYFEIVKPIIN
jgi:hypothetical protein